MSIYLWTGEGWGKTTSAFGVAMRALGHGLKAVVVQFMKGRKEQIGEYRIQQKLDNLTVRQFGRKDWVDLDEPSEEDKQLAQEGLEFAKQALKEKPFLLILDEINLAAAIGLLERREVMEFLENLPPEVNLYLTGRNAPGYLIEKADYVNEIRCIKGPKKLEGEKGIDY